MLTINMKERENIQYLIDIIEPLLKIEPFFNADLGVCLGDFTAVAGTGEYRHNIGKVRPDIHLGEVVRKGKPVIIKDRSNSNACSSCLYKQVCPYEGIIYFPLKREETIIGAVYLMSKRALTDNLGYYSQFISNLSLLISRLLVLETRYKENEFFLDTLMNTINNPIMLIDNDGVYEKVNTAAEKVLNEQGEKDHKIKNLLFSKNNKYLKLHDNYYSSIKHPVKNIGYILELKEEKNIKEDSKENPFASLVGKSQPVKEIIEEASIIAKTDSTVLISGETGTGKELIARAIHQASSRSHKPIILVNCSAIPENLLESELFGYMEGAFTGAKLGGKKGKFELAHEGSIFLDEIGDMPLSLQAKLLRILENPCVDRLGSNEPIYIDIRLITATNKDLEKMVEEGSFRADLFYRLNVIPLSLPSLRERKEDIPLLVNHFLQIFNQRLQKNLTIERDVYQVLINYEWPGNVRELKNVIEYSVTMERASTVTLKSFPKWFKKKVMNSTYSKQMGGLKNMEKEAVEKALLIFGTSTEGKKEAAESLGISLATLYRKIKEKY